MFVICCCALIKTNDRLSFSCCAFHSMLTLNVVNLYSTEKCHLMFNLP